MAVVKAIEAVGSPGGATSKPVTIAKCGQLDWAGNATSTPVEAKEFTAGMAAALPELKDLPLALKEMPEDKKTYDGFSGFGSALPDLSTLKFVKGTLPESLAEGPLVVRRARLLTLKVLLPQ
jgi:hypothetical protein